MLNLKFYSVKEKKPKIGTDIVYLKKSSSFGSEGFEPRDCTVRGVWQELLNGEPTGMSTTATQYGKKPKEYTTCDGVIYYQLELMFDHYIVDDTWYWISLDKYWAAFDKADAEFNKGD